MIEEVFILHHTHTDMVYTGDRTEVCTHLVGMVEQAMDLVEGSGLRREGELFARDARVGIVSNVNAP